MSHSTFRDALATALADVPVVHDAEAQKRMEEHWALVRTWNARVNLTSILDDVEAAWRHYRDSLEALPLLPPGAVVDIGSGAGFPGIPLAIVSPTREFTLLEPRRKRASFLEVAVSRLGLANVRIVCGSSAGQPDRIYDTAVTRATFSDASELETSLSWVAPGGRVIAYRSEPSGATDTFIHSYRIREAQRVLEVWTRPSA